MLGGISKTRSNRECEIKTAVDADVLGAEDIYTAIEDGSFADFDEAYGTYADSVIEYYEEKDDINSNSTGWWVEDISGWWPASQWLKIDGYWIGADGVCR